MNKKYTANGWIDELCSKYRARIAPVFVLHGNVADDVLVDGEFRRLYEHIPRIDAFKNSAITAFFNLQTGVRFASPEMRKLFLELVIVPIVAKLEGVESEPYFESHKRELPYVLDWFEALLSTSWEDERIKSPTGEDLKKLVSKLVQPEDGAMHPFAVTVFEYQESHTPAGASTEDAMLDRRVVVALQWWGQLRAIEDAGNVVLLVTDSLDLVAPQVRSHTKGLVPIRIPYPEQEDQRNNLAAIRTVFPRKDEEVPDEEIVRLTSGLTARELIQIFREASLSSEPLGVDILFGTKAKLIEERLQNLVELYRPAWGWSTIGGLDYVVQKLIRWADAMKAGDIGQLPRGGFLAVGPPGTGKTACAEAFAHEVGIPFCKLKNTFNPFVGQSEMNTDLLHDTLWAMRPLVLLIDEIDKLFVPTSDVYHGDSGVFSRFTKSWMEFLSDPMIHGQIFVFAATNRPDRLDDAMLRAGRFGAKAAFLIPKVDQKPAIWRALFAKEKIRLAEAGLDFQEELTDQEVLDLSVMTEFRVVNQLLIPSDPNVDYSEDVLAGEPDVRLTGGELEKLISMAVQRSEDPVLRFEPLRDAIKRYLPDQKVANYKMMEELALLAVDEDDLVPDGYQEEARKLRARQLSSV